MSEQPEALRLADAIDPLIRNRLDNLTCATAAAELRRLHAEVEALRADAERYRWLRDRATVSHERRNTVEGEKYLTVWHVATGGSDFNIDAAIDAARGQA